MFTTTSIYFFMLFVIIWSYCGYLILLLIFLTLNPEKKRDESLPKEMPKIAVLIPCYNEEGFVKQKIENLKALNYDQDKLEVCFIDGLSKDNTKNEILNCIDDMPNYKLTESDRRGKINQLNYGLSRLNKDVEIIVSTEYGCHALA